MPEKVLNITAVLAALRESPIVHKHVMHIVAKDETVNSHFSSSTSHIA